MLVEMGAARFVNVFIEPNPNCPEGCSQRFQATSESRLVKFIRYSPGGGETILCDVAGWSSGQTTGTLDVTFAGRTSFGDMKLYDVVLVVSGPTCPSGEDRAAGDRSAAFRKDDVHIAVRFAGGAPGTEENIFRFDGALSGSRAIYGSYTLSSSSCPVCTCGIGTSGTWRAFR